MSILLDGVEARFGAFRLCLPWFEAEAQHYTVLLGPSGCGKSLLLGLIAGLHEPLAGRVVLDGKDVTTSPPERRELGLVFQKPSLFPHLSVEENILFGPRVRGLSHAQRRERLAELLALLHLSPLLERPVTALSGGEAQRVALARALAIRPRVLLLDEPLSLVDHNARLELQTVLAQLQAELGLTTLHVTHNRDEARALGQRCAVMLGGRIVQQGAMQQVLETPRCPFVAHFLGLHMDPWPREPRCHETCLAGSGCCDLDASTPVGSP